jgi:hypothetical protein
MQGQYLKSDYESLFRIHSHKLFTNHRNIPRDNFGTVAEWSNEQ